jgi:hypothetical protein
MMGEVSMPVNAIIIASTFNKGYTAKQLALDLALSMIPVSLGKDDKLLCHTINHLATDAEPSTMLKYLTKADSLAQSTSLANGTSASTLNAARKKKEKKGFKCSVHGFNMSHNNSTCKVQLNKAQVASNSPAPSTPTPVPLSPQKSKS